MGLPREQYVKAIADRVNLLAAIAKARSRASFTDASHILETTAKRFFNALFDWNLMNLNSERPDCPAVDLGDRDQRIAIQVTIEDSSTKITRTTAKAMENNFERDYDRLIILFLVAEKPGLPKKFVQPPNGPKIETWDIADLIRQVLDINDLAALARSAKVLEEEIGKSSTQVLGRYLDVSRIIQHLMHAIHAPTSSIRVIADLLLTKRASMPDAMQRSLLADIISHAELLDRLTEGLSLFFMSTDVRRLRYRRELRDLDDIFARTLALVQPLARMRGRPIGSIHLPTTPIRAFVDEYWFTLLVLNLLSNALKYFEQSSCGPFRVAVKCDIRQNYISPKTGQTYLQCLWLEIEDNGIGVAMDQRDLILEPGYRILEAMKVDAEGNGLGLSLVRLLVEDWGGEVFVSNVQKPTAFCIIVPQ